MSVFKQGCLKRDHLFINDKKLGQSYTFLRKRGLIVYLAALEKGTIRDVHPNYVIYR